MLKWVIALAASLGAILEVIDTVITNVALPDIRGNLGATLSEAGWISTSYACANVVIIPLSAWLGYRFGRRNYFVFSLIGFTLASLLCGISNSLGMLIFARVLQGLAGGGLLAKAQSIVFETFSARERPLAQAIFGLGVIVGPAIGPVLGGWLTDNMGWRWIFFINLPLGVLAVLMCTTFMPSDRPEEINRTGKVDWSGIGLLAVGLACFQLFLEEGQQDDWFESRFICTVAIASVIGIILFIWRELTTEHPAVDLRVLRYRSMIGGSLYSAVLGMGLYGIMFAVPIFVQDYLHYTALQSGMILVPGAFASAAMMMAYGKIGNKVSPRTMIFFGALLTSLTGFLLMDINPDTGTKQLFWPLIARGFGSVMMFMPLSIATLGPLDKKDIAAGSGFYSLTRQLGSSIGIALITTLLARREALHRSVLVERISDYRPQVGERIDLLTNAFTAHSGSKQVAHDQAMGLLDRIVSGQAILQSYEDIFTYVAALFIFTLPLLFFLGGKPNKNASDAAAAAH
ncbi:DHA2 family efflux MFS transporter permease subunit [Luteolibacter ambystomatis]|uniref:DHA2 family efflux MFS transporter permease subunit n=1 Tax=Luteolibacter ambystomatis TaxID=2824561 RepID=A0A975J3F1_9BACT|nr:DHA2 family efflux MFS transporter permease subunit [Luteolibacter ambystomatis]